MCEAISDSFWPKVTVVILALNDAYNFPNVSNRPPEGIHEVVRIDGQSVDDTPAAPRNRRPDVRIMHIRRGKSNALPCQFETLIGSARITLTRESA
jgi:hypothetical protein